jgi:DNA-binding response OmpR family regulator
MMKVLVLEDNERLLNLIKNALEKEGYKVDCFIDGDEALDVIDNGYACFILDINVPSVDGISVLEYLRLNHKDIPAIIMSSNHNLEKIQQSYETGCDDYIKKPFDLEELDQRILKLCRHFSIDQNDEIKIDDVLTFLPSSCEIRKEGKKISIAQKERDILKYFVTHKNRVISSDELLQNIWQYDEMPTDATIRVYIKNLRELLGKERIATIRGIGYKFECE